jgi:hypothetical protein
LSEGYWLDELFIGVIGMEGIRRDLLWTREVYSRDLDEIQDG